jgi:hypothetical protein
VLTVKAAINPKTGYLNTCHLLYFIIQKYNMLCNMYYETKFENLIDAGNEFFQFRTVFYEV